MFSRKSKGKGSVTLSKDQAQLVDQLISKELKELATKMHGIADKLALEGKTISVDSICEDTTDMREGVRQGVAEFKKGLLEKYGPTVSVNTAHRISWELEGHGQMWSDRPGCFERHLQRRDGNLLFPKERRIVTQKEIEEARQKDMVEHRQFVEKVHSFASRSAKSLREDPTPSQLSSILQEVQTLQEEATSIGGNIDDTVQSLENVETSLMEQLNAVVPEIADHLRKADSLSGTQRIPYLAQRKRNNSPILNEEEIATLLSEDLATISVLGLMSTAFGPNFRPNEADIVNHLEDAVRDGFSNKRAAQIIDAWNKGKDQWNKNNK